MKIIPKISTVVCCLAALSTALVYAQSQMQGTDNKERYKSFWQFQTPDTINEDYIAWVNQCLEDFKTIKAGMTRREIASKFPADGGLSGAGQVRFLHPTCYFFKIDVDFDFQTDAANQNRPIAGWDDPVIKVSKPYIERMAMD